MNKLKHLTRSLLFLSLTVLWSLPGHAADSWNKWIDISGSGQLQYTDAMTGFLGKAGFLSSNRVFTPDGKKIDLVKPEQSGAWAVFDVDNDGSNELVFCQYNGLYPLYYKVGADGSLMADMLSTMTWNEYNNIRSELKLSSGGEGIPGWGDMFGRDGSSTNSFGGKWNFNVDINGDGIPDLANPKSLHCIDNGGCTEWCDVMLNTGGRLWVENAIEGYADIRDFNGDGITDFASISQSGISVIINHANGTSSTQVLYESDCRRLPLWTFDFDRDNDVDILLVQDKFILFFENDGNGNFTMYDTYVEGEDLEFIGCADVDSDGVYELVVKAILDSTYEIRLYDIPGKGIKDEYTVALSNMRSYGGVTMLDKDHSGIMSIVSNYDSSSYPLSTARNQAPGAPGKPTVTYNPGPQTIKINWGASTDKETSSVDLTYELKIESASGANDMVSACALSDGRRRSIAPGSNGYSRHRTVDVSSWPAGKYYVSVQAIDPNQQGSAFSQTTTFDKQTPASAFRIECAEPKNISVGDTIILSAVPQRGVSFDWKLDGAEIIEASSDKSTLKVRFTTGGNKTLTLSARAGAETSYVRHIDILPASLHSSSRTDIKWAGDNDADGKDEYFNDYDDKFYTQDEKGAFSEIKKIFNNNLTFNWSNMVSADVEGTGLFDLLYFGDQTLRRLENNGDLSFKIGTEQTIEEIQSGALFADIDNDGHIEAIDPSKGILEFNNDYTSFTSSELKVTGIESVLTPTSEDTRLSFGPYKVMDINGDGLIDLIVNIYSHYLWLSNIIRQFVCYNNGDSTFTLGEEIPMGTDNNLPVYIGDLDFDGRLDFVYETTSYAYGVSSYDKDVEIKFGNGRELTVLCPDGRPFSGLRGVFDIDNNGMQDLSFGNSNKTTHSAYSGTIVYLMPDYSVNMVDSNIGVGSETAVVNVANGNVIADDVIIRNILNERPSKPENLRYGASDKGTEISWNAAKDKETPSKGILYNVSVKRKDVSGKGEYVISPLNMGRDYVRTPSDKNMSSATTFTIPVGSLPEGSYEVRVQSVDARGAHSAFSDPIDLNVSQTVKVFLPSTGYINSPVEVKIQSNLTATPDFGADASVRNTGTGTYQVTWSSLGKKDVTMGGVVYGSILVKELPSFDFDLPERIYAGAKVNVKGTNANEGEWTITFGDSAPVTISKSEFVKDLLISDDAIVFSLVPGDYTSFSLTHSAVEMTDRFEKTKQADIVNEKSVPAVSYVSAAENGWNIVWDKLTVPTDATGVKIFRETSRVGDYKEIASVPMTESSFTDTESNPVAKTERYAVTFTLPYGESALSAAHRPVRLELNKCGNGAINLMWSKYEGCDVDSYSIYGGDSPEALALIGSVNGSKSSYVDSAPKAYYAVSVNATAAKARATYAANSGIAVSNVVPASEASEAVLAQKLSIALNGGGDVLDLASAKEFALNAVISPAGATYTKVDWNIEEGKDIASIDENGIVSISAPGLVTVSASTRDGSNLTATETFDGHRIERPFTRLEYSTYPGDVKLEVGETFVPSRLIVEPANATEVPYFESNNPEVATVDENGKVTALRPGMVWIKVGSRLNPELWSNYTVEVNPDAASKAHPITWVTVHQYPAKLQLQVGETFQFKEMHNADAVEQICWTPGDPSVLNIDSNGLATAISPGMAYVRCRSLVNTEVSLGYSITVTEEPVDRKLIESIELSEIVEMEEGDVNWLSASWQPADTDDVVFFRISDASVASLNGSEITALKAGETEVEAFSSHDNGVRDSFILRVVKRVERIPFESIVIDNMPSKPHLGAYDKVVYMHNGETFQFTVTTTGENSNDRVIWSTDDENVFSVDEEGRVTAKSIGHADIYASSKYGKAGDYFHVYVIPENEVPFSELNTHIPPTQRLKVGDTFQCTYTFEPSNATDKVVWESSDPTVAVISDTGLVTALSPGYTHLSVASSLIDYGSIGQSLWVEEASEVERPFESIVIDNSPSEPYLSLYEDIAYMHIGETFKFTAATTGEDCNDQVVWSTSDENILSVDNEGIVTARNVGYAYVVASSMYGEASDQICVYVIPENEIPFSDLNLNIPPTQHLVVGETFQCTYTFEPVDATDNVVWKSDDPAIAEISDTGLVKALTPGCTIIRITPSLISYGGKESTLWVDEEGGIDYILKDSETVDVYNLQGILIRAKADRDYLERLSAGIYIINGRKVTIGSNR